MTLTKLRQDARTIFDAALAAVEPKAAVERHVSRNGNHLSVDSRIYDLDAFENIYVAGAGKAGAVMAAAMEQLLARRLTAGIVIVKYGHLAELQTIKLIEAGHPLPDEAGRLGAQQILALLAGAGERDLVFCLISGGGSALLPLPAEGISLKEKQDLTSRLLACGAGIEEINAVRKHISAIKGGRLALAAAPAELVTLIFSDVVGDKLEAIASGPTVPDPTTFQDVLGILDKYGLAGGLPPAIARHLQRGLAGEIAETPVADNPDFKKTHHAVIASNQQAVLAAKDKAGELGYNPLILSTTIEGETKDVARVHATIAKEVHRTGNPVASPACILSGGETTVTIRGEGKGGRNQEFALAAAIEISGCANTVILSGGTDGTDGPTDAAGAICDQETVARAAQLGLRAEEHLRDNNAYPFFKALGDLLITGPTNTNVMDLRVMLVV